MMNSIETLTVLLLVTPALAMPNEARQVSTPTAPVHSSATPAIVTALLGRANSPEPDAARMRRALAIAGLTELVPSDAITAAATEAKDAYQRWRAETDAAATDECSAGVTAEPGMRVPRRLIKFITQRRLDGFQFEREALDLLLQQIPSGHDAEAAIARSALQARQAESISKSATLNGVADLGRIDLLEWAVNDAASTGGSADQLRASLANYEEERTRMLLAAALAALESDARSQRIATMVKDWDDRRQASSANTQRPVNQSATTGFAMARVAIALQTAQLAAASARMARFQQKTAEQLVPLLSPQSAWSMYATLISSSRHDLLAKQIATIARTAENLPPDQRDTARTLIREYCTTDRPAMQATVSQLVEAIEAQVQPVRSTLQSDSLTDTELDTIDALLASSPAVGASYGMTSVMDSRGRSLKDLERAVRALASP